MFKIFLKSLLPHKRRSELTIGDLQRRAYLAGLAVGIAGMIWIYLLLLVVFTIRMVTGPEKPFKVFASLLFGIATPFWLYLPYYLVQFIVHSA